MIETPLVPSNLMKVGRNYGALRSDSRDTSFLGVAGGLGVGIGAPIGVDVKMTGTSMP
jgi:hypothetical protein